MVFSSLSFLFLFLPIFFIVYFLSPSLLVKNIVLVSSSFIFYGWGNPFWIVFLLGSAIVDYLNGRWIEHFRQSRWKILGLISTLVFNLGLLIAFKYPQFLIDIANALVRTHIKGVQPALPVGMSFYTFETISYTVDVYLGKSTAQRSLLNFMVFIASFPRLVAGPIVRYWQVAHELTERTVKRTDISVGITRFCRGLFKKVFFANVAGELTLRFLDSPVPELTVGGAWFGLLMFTLQIYFDFSGYSDMAIGLGRIIGFELPENFRHPYIANSLTDFWRRWHMTMSSFFRDYVYIPLGGNRRYNIRNIALTWAATGLWHGASWNFVIWGLYFGLLVLMEKLFIVRALALLPRAMAHIYALFFIVIGWLIFHCTDLGRLGALAELLAGTKGAAVANYELFSSLRANAYWIAAAVLLCLPVRSWLAERQREYVPALVARHGEVVLNAGLLLTSITLLVGSSYNPFIYFRF